MTTKHVYDLAVANDDPYPDDVCPGCGLDIHGWQNHEAHFPNGWEPSRPWDRKQRDIHGLGNFTGANGRPDYCPWTHDYLVARSFRRRMIREGITVWRTVPSHDPQPKEMHPR